TGRLRSFSGWPRPKRWPAWWSTPSRLRRRRRRAPRCGSMAGLSTPSRDPFGVDRPKEPNMSAKRILFLVGDFAEDYEVMVPFQALTRVGHWVHAVCRGKKAGEKITTAIH